MLQELGIEQKLLTITGDNVSNNESMISELHDLIKAHYIRCLAHILNLIVKDILRVLRSSDAHEASRICDQLNDEDLSAETALSRIRIFAVWVSRSNKRRASWTNICTFVQISTAFIPCDVDTRWNSTYLMLEAALKAKPQITAYLEAQTELPRFTVEDWHPTSGLLSALQVDSICLSKTASSYDGNPYLLQSSQFASSRC
ncbi:hypothetical protein N7509_000533 [Penicillium cosmopolitanum]|uniref:DUF659 domain-containing protein n=1 Tax=Penicillium cosmopolitanum TaxID=1131564 RepID=A0A9W9WAS0_9EURO|nr:uncharacterized protein N7509_000533 [Penicillium cosmopolitanum]KAJ5413906.1 hypothetical protein N7509_000533 [Penicillium cosmopolitanum]